MLKKSKILLLFVFVFAYCAKAQRNNDSTQVYTPVYDGLDTILLMDGNSIVCTVNDSLTGAIHYLKSAKSKREKVVDYEDVFSISDTLGEWMLYEQDTLGNDYTESEMRYFIYGQQDARNGNYARVPFAVNVVLSAAAGVFGVPGLASNFWTLPMPFIVTGVSALRPNKIRVKEQYVSDLDYYNEPTYIQGYRVEAQRKRKVSAMIGGGIGLIGGLIFAQFNEYDF